MNPYLAFVLRSLGAFIGGLAANTAGHTLILKTHTDWFILGLSGFAAMAAYWGGVISPNPFGGGVVNGAPKP